MDVRGEVAGIVATLKGVIDARLFEDGVVVARILRESRTKITRLIVAVEKELREPGEARELQRVARNGRELTPRVGEGG